jgi:hypothetical protein
MYKGHCVADIMGQLETMPPVKLETLEDCVSYIMLQKQVFKEVIIEDSDEFTILHAVDGKIVFPEQFAGR